MAKRQYQPGQDPNATQRPGFMLYFQTLDAMIEDFDIESLGIMLQAMYQYAKNGVEPQFEDRVLKAHWHYVKDDLDRDAIAYAKAKNDNRRKAYLRSWYAYAAEHGIDKQDEIERDKWIDTQISIEENNL